MQGNWLYCMDAKGNLRKWRTWAEAGRVYTEYGTVDGRMQQTSKLCEPKNVGRSNETTAEEQAEKESAALYKNKLDRKYVLDPSLAGKALVFKPMLAKQWEKVKTKRYPAYIQPKLDGLRCLAVHNGSEWELVSRSGTVKYDLPHIVDDLTRMTDEYQLNTDVVLDGEVYRHGMAFQKISSLGRKLQPESSRLQYHVYDCAFTNEMNAEQDRRLNYITDLFAGRSKNVVEVEFSVVSSEAEAEELMSTYLSEGYEGAIIRDMYGRYKWGKRSSDLIKMKSFDDTEFRVVGYREGRGRLEGCAIWVCDGPGCIRPFECKQAAPDEFLRDIYNKLRRADMTMTDEGAVRDVLFHEFGTDMLKVKHMGYTDDGLPRHPVGIGFRGAEDM